MSKTIAFYNKAGNLIELEDKPGVKDKMLAAGFSLTKPKAKSAKEEAAALKE